ncbi:alanyl-tRNA synthetase [Uncinocarpus reesii 1704]|uniref:Alanine--tRNA ligase n=1 Tax=Uncinocarpus reesii (strain UAMH 1704) TaxID=336963 RepID=C4JI31_UNCRE|nr:alanyl-tRNA synthetase [Uncinocarpus reesii 1704]EEP76607.1 alanyl-tRNA synthetase [Uncinocarpus reesii 1704]
MASSTSAPSQREIDWPAVKPSVPSPALPVIPRPLLTFMLFLVPSSSVVPLSDPTLLFANAGMNQYKSIFLGTVDPNSDFAHLKRAHNSQKCIRAGGKHNDLDDVGKDSYHHTFFEMLGNWSFGDYFKKEAIQYSWDLLTKVYGLEPDRLYVTYFEGNKDAGIEPDLETKDLWLGVGVKEDHILSGNMKDNFWEMGDQGPCGPCSEVHYDRIGGRNAAHLVNMDDPNVLEIWNNVFIQYNRESEKILRPLPNKHVDTGLGYERLVSVLQDKSSNYDTDVFSPLFDVIREITGVRPYAGKFGEEDVDGIDTAYRVVADHVRTLTFAISDGAAPNNEGRGYVWTQMGDMFPEIKKKQTDVMEILDEEEISFAKTLDRGERQFEIYAQQAKESGSGKLHGADVWRLYDTFGFPVDLTQLMAEERGLSIDNTEFEEARLKAKEASKGQAKAASDLLKLTVHDLGKLEKDNVPKTDDSAKFGRGNIQSQILSIYHGKEFVASTNGISAGEQIGIILDKTNFYAEQGGQEYDIGKIIVDGHRGVTFQFGVPFLRPFVFYAKQARQLPQATDGKLQERLLLTRPQRHEVSNNHTGTHILNFALREVLGNGIDQKGSLVAAEKLRFDFSHKSAISDSDLEKIEAKSTEYIRQNCAVYSQDVPLAKAREITGVRAVFGETYPDPVRVVSVGVELDEILKDVKDPRWKGVSIEFCGGTHVQKTGDIKDLVILEESGIAKGIRRIIAVTGKDAHEVQRIAREFGERLNKFEKMEQGPQKEQEAKLVQVDLNQLSISAVEKARFRDQFARIHKQVLDAQKALQKQEIKAALDTINSHFEKPENKDTSFLVVRLPTSANAKAISESINHVKSKLKDKSLYVFAADEQQGRVAHGCYVSSSLSAQGASASSWSGVVSAIVGGNGTDVGKVDEALDAATKYLEQFKL